MREYPCLEIEGNKISLVYPYTLNDRLITDFQVDYQRDYYNFLNNHRLITQDNVAIYITNDDNFRQRFIISQDQLQYMCENACRCFLQLNREDARIYEADYSSFGYDYRNCFSEWLTGCINQVGNIREFVISASGYSRYDRLRDELRRQNRYDEYRSSSFVLDNGSRITPIITTTSNRANYNREYMCSWDNLSEHPVKLIHPYNYIPKEYKKWYVDGEDKITTLLLGAEIEVDEGGETDETAGAVLKIMHDGEFKEDKMFAVHDGSLNRGIEFVTMPCSLEYHKRMNYKEIFHYLDEHGYKGHDSAKAGLHIHINRDFFKHMYNTPKLEKIYVHYDYFNGTEVKLPDGTDLNSVRVYNHLQEVKNEVSNNGYYIINDNILMLPKGYQNRGKIYTVQYIKEVSVLESQNSEQECIGKLMYIIEKFEDEMSAISRRDCRYSKLLGYNGEKCKEMYSKGYKVRDKYAAVNLLHQDTIELRIFKSTLKYETFINTLEFVSRLAYFVKDHTEEEVENMTWNDLFETFSDDLKGYYLQRKEIEDKKKAEKKDGYGLSDTFVQTIDLTLGDRNVVEAPSITHDRLSGERARIYIDGQAFDGVRCLECISSPAFEDNSFREFMYRWNSTMEGSFTCEPISVETLSQLCGESFCDIGELQTIEAVKKRIKDIKQKMKHARNYIEKKSLESELQRANKKLKEVKHKTNQN